MTQLYTLAITDGGYTPIDIKTNLIFKDVLKEALTQVTSKDITEFCNIYAISTNDLGKAIKSIQQTIERHIKNEKKFYYEDDNNFIINITTTKQPLNNISIKICGQQFFAFAKPNN